MNADGLVDLIYWYNEKPNALYEPSYCGPTASCEENAARIYLNDGAGFVHSGQWDESKLTIDSERPASAPSMSAYLDRLPNDINATDVIGDARVRMADFDSDGRPELFSTQAIVPPGGTYVPPHSSGPTTHYGNPRLYTNPGLGTLTTHAVADSLISAASFLGHHVWVADSVWEVSQDFIDLNGDGEPENVAPKQLGELRLSQRNTNGQPLRLLNRIDNGIGGITEVSYAAQNDASVAKSSQSEYAVMPRHVWVVKDVTTTDTTTGLASVRDVHYGDPVWNQNDHGKWGFRGFDSIESTAAHALGATTGFSTSVRDYGYDVDWSGRLIRSAVYADGIQAEASSTWWEAYELFGGATVSYHKTLSQSDVCEIEDGGCSAHTSTSYARSTYRVVQDASGNAVAWVLDGANTQQVLAPFGVGQTEGDLLTTFDYDLYASADKYWLFNTSTIREVADGALGWKQTGETVLTADALQRYAETTTVYLDETKTAVSREVRDPDTGLLVEAVTPKLEHSTWDFDGFKVHPTAFTNALLERVESEVDLGTGLATRVESPNMATCGASVGPQASSTSYDGFGRVTESGVFACLASDVYGYYKTSQVEYTNFSAGAPERTTVRSFQDYAGLDYVEAQSDLDGFGRVVESRLDLGNGTYATATQTFDERGLQVGSSVPNPAHNSDAMRTHSSSRYDALGRLVSTRVGDSTGAAPLASASDTEWNAYVGVDVSFQLDGDSIEKTATEHVLDTNLPTTETTMRHDMFGRLVRVDELLEDGISVSSTAYEYDGNDNLSTITDPDGVITVMKHNWVGSRRRITRGERNWNYEYDLNGQLILETSPVPNGALEIAHQTSYVYDALGRLKYKAPAIGELSADDQKLFGANAVTAWHYGTVANNTAGHLESVTGPFYERKYEYNSLGLPSLESFSYEVPTAVGMPGTVRDYLEQEFSYTAAGQLKVLATKAGEAVYAFDNVGRADQLVWKSTSLAKIVAELERNVAGRVILQDSGNVERTWDYDSHGRVVDTMVYKGGPNKWRFHETMDYLDSNEVSTHQVRRNGLADRTFNYDYDSRHQLLNANDNGGYASVFTYTPGGKVDTASIDPLAVAPQVFGRFVDYTYGDQLSVDGHAVESLRNASDGSLYAGYSYDISGNVTERQEYLEGPNSLVTRYFTYDGLQKMRRAETKGGNQELYYYDENGQRYLAVETTSKAVVRTKNWFGPSEYWYSGGGNESKPSVKLTGSTYEKAMINLSLGGLAVARVDFETGSDEFEYSFHNGLGHLMGTLDDNGNVTTAFVYGPYGEIIDELGDVDTHLRRFNGKDADPLSRLNYYGYRYYDPLSLSWTQPDPLFSVVPDLAGANPRDMNLFTFTLNNPVRYVDPDGLQAMPEDPTAGDGNGPLLPESDGSVGRWWNRDTSGPEWGLGKQIAEEGNDLIKRARAGINAAWYGGRASQSVADRLVSGKLTLYGSRANTKYFKALINHTADVSPEADAFFEKMLHGNSPRIELFLEWDLSPGAIVGDQILTSTVNLASFFQATRDRTGEDLFRTMHVIHEYSTLAQYLSATSPDDGRRLGTAQSQEAFLSAHNRARVFVNRFLRPLFLAPPKYLKTRDAMPLLRNK